MKRSTQHKIMSLLFFLTSSLSAFAQVKASSTIEIDALTKIIGALFTIGGFYMAFMQLKMANKIQAMENKFNETLNEMQTKFNISLNGIKEEFHKTINGETDKLEDKIRLSQKEIESRMATHHDIANFNQVGKLQHEIIQEQLKNLKEAVQDLKVKKI